ncbi:MAG: cupin domain-containing protein, partial [Candidatus Limnocylindrales bacterium]
MATQRAVRRVVTGHDADGKAVFASDVEVEPVMPAILTGSAFHLLWGADATPTFPDDGSEPATGEYFPAVGGFRFGLFTVPPRAGPDAGTATPTPDELAAGMAEVERLLPGLLKHMEPDDPGMHTTATIDFEVVLAGEVTLELDDGQKVVLGPGDTVVQN